MSSASTAAVAALTVTICFIGAPHSAYGRAELPTPDVVLTSSPNPSNVGDLVTFTATVSSPGGPTPQGSITIAEYPQGGQAIYYGTVNLSNGVGVVTTDKVAVGTHVIWATYGGEAGVYNGAQSYIRQVVNPVVNNVSAEPLQRVIPVHLDAGTGNIMLGSTVYKGANPGMHLLAFSRQPDSKHLDAPDVIQDGTFHDASSANQFLTNNLADEPDAFLIVNAVGNYGFGLNPIAKNLEKFGAWPDIEGSTEAIPFVLLGNGGRNMGQDLQRGFSTRNVDGYLAADSNGNYTFIQTDYVQYDITTDGTIKVGPATYDVASSYKPLCSGDASNSFHLVIVDRETLQLAISPTVVVNNTYCTAQSDTEIKRLVDDLSVWAGQNEGRLAFLASNGHPIPSNWNFGTDGDARFYPLAQQVAKLGGYWETMVYLTPNDTYSLVGAVPPPIGTAGARNRARESSSVYPDHPTGELHGVLARGARGNWYSPLDADPTGQANLGFYQILAQAPVAFPVPAPNDNAQLGAFQYISSKLCGTDCNVRNQYPNINIDIDTYQTALATMNDPSTNAACPNRPNSAFCIVRQQLLTEFQYVGNIRNFNDNLTTLWASSGTVTIFELLKTSNDITSTLKPPPTASAPNLVEPIVSFFLGLASELPVVGKVAGIAETTFRFASSLTTDKEGNEQISLTSTVAQVAQQAADQFTAQGTTTGTQFDFIYQDWGKIQTLGTALAQAQPGSPWYWDTSATGRILQGISPAIEQSYYRSLMAALYAIGSYVPTAWGSTSIYTWQQPPSYHVYDAGGPFPPGQNPIAIPFNYPWYPPYTFPTDPTNPIEAPSDPAYTQATPTLLADGSWLGISLQSSPSNSGPNGLYNPPDPSVLAHLFTPQSKGGLGVYRPAFFEGWPFPRVTCDRSAGDYGGYWYPGGCTWSAAAPSPDVVPGPVTNVSLGLGTSNQKFAVKGQIQIPLTIINSGTQELQSIEINDVSLRTLTGSGEAVLADPLLPIKLGRLAPGNTAALNLIITVPPSVKKLGVTEQGTASNSTFAPPAQFSFGQAVFPGKQQ
jgi:hypothetical protein